MDSPELLLMENDRVDLEEELQAIFAHAPICIFLTDGDARLHKANPALTGLFGRDAEAMVGHASGVAFGCVHVADHPGGCGMGPLCKDCGVRSAITDTFSTGRPHLQVEASVTYRRDGLIIDRTINLSTILVTISGRKRVLVCLEDITEQKLSEVALRESEEKNRFLADMLQSSSQPFATSYADGRLGLVNSAFCNLLGYGPDELRELRWNRELVPPEWFGVEADMMARLVETGRPVCYEREYIHKDGRRIPVEILAHVRHGETGDPEIFFAFITDLTERRRLETQAKELNDQLFQAQKMESVGRLAGGVAHDYNNMLGVILGYAQMALDKIEPESAVCEDLQEILGAARRSAGITRQLLAFARKEAISPRVLDLNETIEDMLKMLKRLIGEDIQLTWFPESDLWPVMIDPSQIDQLLANLCVNARDAIAGGGKITIGTGMASLDSAYCGQHPGAVPGDYVLLTVSDNGHGIEKEILDRIFEPFFTTKAMDRGTGLGLATVYGIVNQNNGFVTVCSEPDDGTTFSVYLPRYAEQIVKVEKKDEEQILRGRNETVLVVEDEAVMLKLTVRILKNLGYTVLAANSSEEAVRLARENAGRIDLLISDVIMPEMNGRDLAGLLRGLQADLRCLFMSGYAAGVVVDEGVLDEGAPFIQKPFSARDLAAKVRELLSR